MLNAPTFDDALESLTLGDSDHVDHFVCAEDRVNLNFLFEVGVSKIDFLGCGATVDLDFEHMVLLLSQVGEESQLGGDYGSHNCAVFSYSV